MHICCYCMEVVFPKWGSVLSLGPTLLVAAFSSCCCCCFSCCCCCFFLDTWRCACVGYKYICFNFRTFGSAHIDSPGKLLRKWARLKAQNGCDVVGFPFCLDFCAVLLLSACCFSSYLWVHTHAHTQSHPSTPTHNLVQLSEDCKFLFLFFFDLLFMFFLRTSTAWMSVPFPVCVCEFHKHNHVPGDTNTNTNSINTHTHTRTVIRTPIHSCSIHRSFFWCSHNSVKWLMKLLLRPICLYSQCTCGCAYMCVCVLVCVY